MSRGSEIRESMSGCPGRRTGHELGDGFLAIRSCLILTFLLLTSIGFFSPCSSFAQVEPEEEGRPLMFSVFPTIGQQGSTVKVEARGVRIDGAYAVWFDGGGLQSRILSVEEVKNPTKPRVDPLEK